MRFAADTHQAIAQGSIVGTIRFWKRAQVKVGGHYKIGPVTVEVDLLQSVPFESIDDQDAKHCGVADREALIAMLSRWAREPLTPDRLVWRVQFHRVAAGDDRPSALARLGRVADLSDDEMAGVIARLDAIDRRSSPPWTRQVLALIAEQPGVVSTTLAAQLGRDRPSFKEDLRKLKRLGLTESLEIGYRLSPRGEAIFRHMNDAGDSK